MQKVLVRGADGERVSLAFVRRDDSTVFVCAERWYQEAVNGNDDAVVGFPARDVDGLDAIKAQ